jgi:hypothetical protein
MPQAIPQFGLFIGGYANVKNNLFHIVYFAGMAAKGLGWLTKTKWDSLNRILNKVAVYC